MLRLCWSQQGEGSHDGSARLQPCRRRERPAEGPDVRAIPAGNGSHGLGTGGAAHRPRKVRGADRCRRAGGVPPDPGAAREALARVPAYGRAERLPGAALRAPPDADGSDARRVPRRPRALSRSPAGRPLGHPRGVRLGAAGAPGHPDRHGAAGHRPRRRRDGYRFGRVRLPAGLLPGSAGGQAHSVRGEPSPADALPGAPRLLVAVQHRGAHGEQLDRGLQLGRDGRGPVPGGRQGTPGRDHLPRIALPGGLSGHLRPGRWLIGGSRLLGVRLW